MVKMAAGRGLDRAPTHGFSQHSQVTPISIEPKEHGLGFDSLDGLQVNTAADSADLIRSACGSASDEASHKARAIIALNAGVGACQAHERSCRRV